MLTAFLSIALVQRLTKMAAFDTAVPTVDISPFTSPEAHSDDARRAVGKEWDAAMTCFATNDYYTEDEQSNYAWWLNVERDGTLRAFWEYEDGNNVSVFSSEPAGLDEEWHHVAFTRTEDEVRFYIDGVLLGEPQSFDRLPTGANRGMLYLGADTDGDYPMDGALRNFQVHDRALIGSRIVQTQAFLPRAHEDGPPVACTLIVAPAFPAAERQRGDPGRGAVPEPIRRGPRRRRYRLHSYGRGCGV